MDSVKQVIVIRKDLKMRKGKIAAQAAHASMKVILDMMPFCDERWGICHTKITVRRLAINTDSPMDKWLKGQFTKICLYVTSEEELDDIYSRAKEAGLPCALITDSGATEFHGVETKTCCAIGPHYSQEIDKITGELPLL
tara:strand:- start:56000 stop:56419 length:420 start_codon:yes stop_codon:yes gene_type:complete